MGISPYRSVPFLLRHVCGTPSAEGDMNDDRGETRLAMIVVLLIAGLSVAILFSTCFTAHGF